MGGILVCDQQMLEENQSEIIRNISFLERKTVKNSKFQLLISSSSSLTKSYFITLGFEQDHLNAYVPLYAPQHRSN